MKFGTCVFLGASGLMALGLSSAFALQGCGGNSSSNPPADGGTGATGDSGGTGSTGSTGADASGADANGGTTGSTVPPPAPTGPTTTSTTPHNFALHHVHLGDELDANGSPDWYLYGYDIDGKDTAKSSKDVCSLYENASTQNQVDGPGGIDNSFGANIISTLLQGIVSNPSQTVSTAIVGGHFTVMLDLLGLDEKPADTFTGLTGQLYAGVSFGQGPNATGAVPTFTTADNWPIDPAYVMGNPAPGTALTPPISATVSFTGAYIVNGVFVSGAPTSVTLSLTIEGQSLQLPIQHATITFNNPGSDDAGTSGTQVSGGVISGIIDAEQLVTNIQGVAGTLSKSFCDQSEFASIAKGIRQAADIMDDGTNVAGVPCTGISVGLGFVGDVIGHPLVVGAPTTGANPCSDAGPVDAGPPADAGSPTDAGSADQ